MDIVKFNSIEERIIVLHNAPVLLDSDVAFLYGVETRDINKAVKNNPRKFPEGYIISLSYDDKKEVVENFHHLEKLKFSPALPNAFTEQGLYMLATILKGDRAIDTTIDIIDAFTRLRQLSRVMKQMTQEPDEEKQKPLMKRAGELIGDILDNDLEISETETSYEMNLAMVKIKHTVKRTKKKTD
ncbi:MAG: ORF6N domain-containing protein [Bacteroidales bacterium]|nr:ORF6N domain-containing protein [Bacteroidales bacterium]